MLIALRLDPKDPSRVLSMPADVVMTMWHYEIFRIEYEETMNELNKSEP